MSGPERVTVVSTTALLTEIRDLLIDLRKETGEVADHLRNVTVEVGSNGCGGGDPKHALTVHVQPQPAALLEGTLHRDQKSGEFRIVTAERQVDSAGRDPQLTHDPSPSVGSGASSVGEAGSPRRESGRHSGGAATLRLKTEVLERYRRLANLRTDAALANRMDYDAGNLSRVLRGKQTPGPKFIASLCAAFDASLEELFEVVVASNEDAA